MIFGRKTQDDGRPRAFHGRENFERVATMALLAILGGYTWNHKETELAFYVAIYVVIWVLFEIRSKLESIRFMLAMDFDRKIDEGLFQRRRDDF